MRSGPAPVRLASRASLSLFVDLLQAALTVHRQFAYRQLAIRFGARNLTLVIIRLSLFWIITESDRPVTPSCRPKSIKLNYFQYDHNADSSLRLTSSPSRISGGEQWRYGWRRAAVLGRLFVTVANLDQ